MIQKKIRVYSYFFLYTVSGIVYYKVVKEITEMTHQELLEQANTDNAQEELRSGTWATIRYAEKLQKIRVIIRPNGQLYGWNRALQTLKDRGVI